MKRKLLALVCSLPLWGMAQWNDLSIPITNDLEDVFFVDNNNGMAVGRQGKIIRTADGGASWTEMNSGTVKDINKVFMVNPATAFAVGDGGVVVKYNGSSWSTISIGFSQDMFGVFFLDASTGWISGDWGRIMKTTDGGSTWTTQMSNSIYSNTFNDLHMISATEGWAVGSSGRVLEYDGTNWTNFSNPASANLTDLHAVSFSASNNGFMTGESSTVFHFDGSSWTQDNTALSNNSYHVYDVFTVNSGLAYAATSPGFGGQGIILKYNGNTWVKDYEYTGMNSELFTGLAVSPSGRTYACASIGIMKSNAGSGGPSAIAKYSGGTEVKIYPNPFISDFTIGLKGAAGSEIVVTMTDISGRVVSRGTSHVNADGEYRVAPENADLAPGTYFYTAVLPTQVFAGKILKQ